MHTMGMMGISVKMLQYLPQVFDYLLGLTFFPPDQKRGKVLKKGQFQHEGTCKEGTSKHAAACLEGYFKHVGQETRATIAYLGERLTHPG